ncbi:hypothetical protein K488DRAFT_10171, partial [Vararia minispora EC-137]
APTVAIIAAGAMGAAVARRLTDAGCTVLTSLAGRSEATRRRAIHAGMRDVPFKDLPRSATMMLSILPPNAAESLAKSFLEAWRATGNSHPVPGPVYVDCNAVSPKTVKEIAGLFEGSGVRFVDAGIIGGPPHAGYDPTFYASGDEEHRSALDAFSNLKEYGLKVKSLTGEGTGVGDASALKMSYAGITKGLTGLLTTMILSANASSPATATALMHELRTSQPMLLQRATRALPDMLPKAYRWHGEMREISDFVGGSLGDVHRGMAALYERIEQAVDEDNEDKRVLEQFVKDAREVLE